jgi:hypothetical protein
MSEITAEEFEQIGMTAADITPENYKKKVILARKHFEVALYTLKLSFGAETTFQTIEEAKLADHALHEMKHFLNQAATIWTYLPEEARVMCRNNRTTISDIGDSNTIGDPS